MAGIAASLCNNCHRRPSKYKCPRCSRQHCSLECVKRHKKGWHCNGERDQTAFVPAKRLRTDAGIDHDYNFLYKVDRSLEQANKLVEERGLVPQQRPNSPPPTKRARLHKGQSRGKTKIGQREWPRPALQRLAKKEISVVHLPYGMSRMKENNTSWHKKTRTINWQVEWLLLGVDGSSQPVRMLHKSLDEQPLHTGFAAAQEYQRRGQLSKTERHKENRQRREEEEVEDAYQVNDYKVLQDAGTSSWRAAPEARQDAATGGWTLSTFGEQHENKYQFFFQLPGTPAREPTRLLHVKPTDTLCHILSGLSVLEFPTICVLPVGAKLPSGYIRDKRSKAKINETLFSAFNGGPRPTPREKKIEVVEGDSNDEDYVQGMGSDESDSEASKLGFEFDDVVKMADFLEEGEVKEAADTTSSSGTSSDSDMDVD